MTQLELGNSQAPIANSQESPARASRPVMNGKKVFSRPAKSMINFESNFSHKLLCDGATFSAGDACVYSCAFCYVPDLMRKLRHSVAYKEVRESIQSSVSSVQKSDLPAHEEIVVRREGAVEIARRQLQGRKDVHEKKVIYSSPLVDVAGNMELVRETVEICKVILELTNWDIRLLSKSNLLPKVAEGLDTNCTNFPEWKKRLIFGVSTGTLDDGLAKVFEEGTPLVSKRIQSLHWLQDNGFRTFGMICPSLPHENYWSFAEKAAAAIRADRCEHVWAEVINVRGESFSRTIRALERGGFYEQADCLNAVGANREHWETYARKTFEAHAGIYGQGQMADGKPKLRFLQYVTPASRAWWGGQRERGAVLL